MSASFAAAALIILFLIRGRDAVQISLDNLGVVLLNKIVAQGATSNLVDIALKTADLSLRVAPDTFSTQRWRGYVFAYAGREETAVSVWQRHEQMYAELFERGKLAYEAADYEASVIWLGRSTRVQPNYADAWYYMGLAYERLNDSQQAEQSYLTGLKSTEFTHVHVADFYFRLGWLAGQGGSEPNWPEALAYYDQAVRATDFSEEYIEIQTHIARGEALQKVGRNEEAIVEFEWVLARDAQNMAALVQLGFLIWGVHGDFVTAEALFRQAMALDANNKWPFRGLALIYQETGQKEEAIVLYEQAYSLDPTDLFVKEQLEKLLVEE